GHAPPARRPEPLPRRAVLVLQQHAGDATGRTRANDRRDIAGRRRVGLPALQAGRRAGDRAAPRRIPVVILRIAGVYDEDCHSIPIAQHIRRIREKKLESYLLPGDPDHGQAFLHLDDLIDCIERVIARRMDLGSFQVFLVAEQELMTYRELQHRIGMRLHGKEWPTIRSPAAVAKAGAWIKDKLSTGEGQFIKPWMIDLADDHYPISIARARERLGFEPKRRLRTTLEVM